jgi:hypothetical protein
MRIGAEVYHALRGIIIERYGALSASVGDEGGFAPDLADVAEALELIMAAIKATGHQDVVRIALDVAASELAVRFAALCLELVTRTCHTNSSHELVTRTCNTKLSHRLSSLCRRVCFCVPQLHRVFGHRGGVARSRACGASHTSCCSVCDCCAVAQVKDAEGKAVQPFLYKLSPDDEALSSAQLLALYQVLPAWLQTPFAGLKARATGPKGVFLCDWCAVNFLLHACACRSSAASFRS